MRCSIHEGLAGAPQCAGHVVVIDVIRAFTTAACAFGSGASRIVLVGEAEQAFSLRTTHPDWLLVGESGGERIAGFDYGNSPEAMRRLDLRGRTLVLRSSSGTQGVVAVSAAERMLLGSLAVAGATARWLKDREVGQVSLLAMRSTFGPDGDEDVACAEFLALLLDGRQPDPAPYQARVRDCAAGQMAFDPSIPWMSPGDLEQAAAVDSFEFAMPVQAVDGLLIATADPL